MVGSVTRGRWQARDENEEVEQVAYEDGGELFEEAGEHGRTVSSFEFQVARKSSRGFTRMQRIILGYNPRTALPASDPCSAGPTARYRPLIYHRTVLDLATNVQFVKGIGPRIADMLVEKGVTTVEDLLYYLPFRYEDRLNPRGIGELRPGEMASVIAEVRTSGLFRTRRMPIFEMTVGQGRDTLKCIWFNATYLQDKFRAGQTGGALRKSGSAGAGARSLPDHAAAIRNSARPHRRRQQWRRGRAQVAVARSRKDRSNLRNRGQGKADGAVVSPRRARNVGATRPGCYRRDSAGGAGAHGADRSRTAFWQAHWPEVGESLAKLQSARTPALFRLIFEELFFLELGLELKRRKMRAQTRH